jgi:AcrR family transcriptional regulator
MNAQKEEIANRFQKHFEHFGYKKTSVDDIAKELKISKKTIYQHFNTKEEIFYYIVSKVAQQYMNRMAADLKELPTAKEKLDQLVRMIFTESRKWLKENDAFEFRYKYDIAGLAFRDAYNDLLAELIHEGIDAGEFRQGPVALTVRFINGIISESMKVLSANPELVVEEEVIAAINRLLI